MNYRNTHLSHLSRRGEGGAEWPGGPVWSPASLREEGQGEAPSPYRWRTNQLALLIFVLKTPKMGKLILFLPEEAIVWRVDRIYWLA
jgi:hypothetical protein